MRRRQRLDLRQAEAATTKGINKKRKDKERSRRSSRMAVKLEAGELPYTPVVMSWLSETLDKPANRIQTADVKALLASSS